MADKTPNASCVGHHAVQCMYNALLEQDRKEHDSCLIAWELGSFIWHHSVGTMPNAVMQQISIHSSGKGKEMIASEKQR